MEKASQMYSASNQAQPLRVEGSCPRPSQAATCEGCLALTGDYLCDLGIKTERILKNNVPIGLRSLEACTKINEIDDYLMAHLKKM